MKTWKIGWTVRAYTYEHEEYFGRNQIKSVKVGKRCFTLLEQSPDGAIGLTISRTLSRTDTGQAIRVLAVTSSPIPACNIDCSWPTSLVLSVKGLSLSV